MLVEGYVTDSELNFLETSVSRVYTMAVNLLAVKSKARTWLGGNDKKMGKHWRAGTVGMDKRVIPL